MNFGPQVAQGMVGGGSLAGAPETLNRAVLQQAPAPQPDTLLRALSEMEHLNRRLGELSCHVEEIATAIGGPWPCDKPQSGSQPAPQPPAMVALNIHVDAAHQRVTSIEEAIRAIRRSLGA